MKTIEVKYTNSKTKIQIEKNILSKINTFVDENKKYLILTDETVYKLYHEKLNINNSTFYILPIGEQEKNYQNVSHIIASLLELKMEKTDYLINFGGGVISDLGGFVASIYKRGINYINIPTTLIAQVDASIGGKTGIDYQNYKNQIGTIYQPKLVFVDPTLLNTLPNEQYLSGLGEVIKYAICFDEEMFNSLFNDINLENIVTKCIEIKAKITAIDELDEGVRLILNFGHTIGHAIEAITNYTIPHGICIAIGMLYEIDNLEIKDKLTTLLNLLGFPIELKIDKEKLINYIMQDKKIRNGILKLPKLEKIGKAVIIDEKITDFIKRFK